MSRRRLLRLSLTTVAVVVVVALVAVVVSATIVVRRPLPEVAGEQQLPGLDATVSVTRDERGVPTITATTAQDLFRAQGYVAAQDRFFEMDYRRHVTAGRLSELVGENEDALAADKVIRTFGWREVAEQEWDLLQPATREALQAYADGVNAYLDGKDPGAIAVEYSVLGLQTTVRAPREWDPVDSLAWLKAMAWDLRGNYDAELERAASYSSVGDIARVDQLFPAYPQDLNLPILAAGDGPVAEVQQAAASTEPLDLGSSDLQEAMASAAAALAAVPHVMGDGEGVGSNSWVVSGEFTESGKPLLANDPHLGISAPGIWEQVGLRCAEVSADCPYDVSGFAFAGLPGVVIGHNAELAWGLTNLGADVTDFFIERVDGDATLLDGAPAPITERQEVIRVNGGDDVHLTVRESVHGPLVSDVLDLVGVSTAPVPDDAPGRGFQVALRWTALQPGRTMDAVLAINVAKDAEDIQEAAALFDVPSQNIVFATTDGHIGYQAPGRIPVRSTVPTGPVPSNGTWPRPGWDSRYDWQGFVDPATMPRALDPAEGFIVTANQAVLPAGVGPFLTADWDYGYRAQRIRELLSSATGEDKVSVADMGEIQVDQHSPFADVLVPVLLELDIEDSFDDDGQELLRTWDRVQSADSAAAAYFAAVWVDVLEAAFADDLPDGYGPSGGSRWLEVVRRLVDEPASPWWDDKSTPGVVEGRDEVLTRAMVDARLQLTAQLGREATDWRWGKVHVAAPEHPVLGGSSLPGVVRDLMNPDPVAVGGGSSIVDATAWDASSGSFAVTAAPSMRMVVDLGDLDASTWVTLTGASGHPASVHYADQLGPWSRGETFPWPFTRAATEADARDRLTLTP
ncbi:penicillin acylase family protein [Cellulomonas fengjieae]|uniref:Penicillin acylase family protein n=1 Tax=Cellulomonas fengjieae TaxID=2819978 RepID=A0ABS3SLG8_9CELL|nr:penicillin acylase family protein [Cellulomonas fengjieae]MBO3086595.1 penicillin acylase family protein [Cellulomonas fengjieae]QVI66553.1 penicillin acylase family protein [Cellulomonas fengjieae]